MADEIVSAVDQGWLDNEWRDSAAAESHVKSKNARD